MVLKNVLVGCNANQSALVESAKRALREFSKKNLEFEFDPQNNEHVSCYLQLRRCSPRITAESFMKFFQSQKTSVDSSAGERFEYYGVPKVNFPNGLPPEIQKSELHDEDIAGLEMLGGGNIDTDEYFIIDCEAPRSMLGKKVATFEFNCHSDPRAGDAPR